MSDSTATKTAEFTGFLEKLADFHATLEPIERELLDEFTEAALFPPEPEVQGFAGFDFSMPGTTGQMRNTLIDISGDQTTARYYYYYKYYRADRYYVATAM